MTIITFIAENIWKFIIGFLIVRLLWMMTLDFIGMIKYLFADVYNGKIVECLGPVKEKAYISGHSSYYHTFEKYCVEYYFNGQHMFGDVVTAKRDLRVGDVLAVHATNRKGMPEIQTDTCGKKLIFFALIILFSVAITAAIVVIFG